MMLKVPTELLRHCKILNNQAPQLEGYQVKLLPIAECHLEQLRIWRNSEHVRQNMLSQGHISEEQQKAWFAHICRARNQFHYAIEYKQQLIGSCNIKTRGQQADIYSAAHFELGLYIGDTNYLSNIIAFAPTLLMNDYCFESLKAAALHAVVIPENIAALRYNQQLGYKIVKRAELVELSLEYTDYQLKSQLIKRLLDRPKK
jgi:RimJ/RimL family protein N-acetyltransferase